MSVMTCGMKKNKTGAATVRDEVAVILDRGQESTLSKVTFGQWPK